MIQPQHNILLHPGTAFSNGFQFLADPVSNEPIDLTGWTFAAQIRTKPGAELVLELVAAINGDPTLGVVEISLPAETVKPPGYYEWDLVGTPPGDDPAQPIVLIGGFCSITSIITEA